MPGKFQHILISGTITAQLPLAKYISTRKSKRKFEVKFLDEGNYILTLFKSEFSIDNPRHSDLVSILLSPAFIPVKIAAHFACWMRLK